MDQIIVGNKYRLKKKIGAGSFGEIFAAEDIHTHELYAIKTENIRAKCPQLLYEAKLYSLFQGSPNIPQIYDCGTEASKNYMVIDLLSKSIEDLFALCHRKFSVKTVLMLADQMISCVQFLHEKNYLHRDIKPDNFAIGRGKNANKVYIIDYGLSKLYRDPNTLEHVPYEENKNLSGTARYASINALRGIQQSRRDDLEALGYVWLYLLRGSLPWMGLQANGHLQKYRRILESKVQTPVEMLCKGFPLEFIQYFYYVRRLQYYDTPDYSYLRRLMRRAFERLNYVYDYQYDWAGMKIETVICPKKDVLVKRTSKKGQPSTQRPIYIKKETRNFESIVSKDDLYRRLNQQTTREERILSHNQQKNPPAAPQRQYTARHQQQNGQQTQQLCFEPQTYERLVTARKRRESEKPQRHTPQLLTPSVRDQMQMKKVERTPVEAQRPFTTQTGERKTRVTAKPWNELPHQSKLYRY